MITFYLALYFVFVILIAVAVSYMVLRLKLPSPRLVISLLLLFIVSPLIIGYFYVAYFNSLPEATAPDVTGLTFELAKEKIEAAGLKAREAGTINEMKYPEGSVASQRPEGGRRVKIGRVVNLMISSGKKKISTPNLIGKTIPQAEALLAAVELKLGEAKSENNPGAAEGTILAQEPLPGEEIEIGSQIDLLVASSTEAIPREGNDD